MRYSRQADGYDPHGVVTGTRAGLATRSPLIWAGPREQSRGGGGPDEPSFYRVIPGESDGWVVQATRGDLERVASYADRWSAISVACAESAGDAPSTVLIHGRDGCLETSHAFGGAPGVGR